MVHMSHMVQTVNIYPNIQNNVIIIQKILTMCLIKILKFYLKKTERPCIRSRE